MIYQLFQLLGNFPGARLMTYISFRAIIAGVLALCISIWVGRWFIQLLQRKNISETQRDESIDPFNVAKKGVPTMGGVVIIAAMLIPCLLMGKLSNIYMLLMLYAMGPIIPIKQGKAQRVFITEQPIDWETENYSAINSRNWRIKRKKTFPSVVKRQFSLQMKKKF